MKLGLSRTVSNFKKALKRALSFTNTYSLDFDGSDARIDTSAIDLGLENTISFWAKRGSANFYGMVWGGTSQSNYYVVYLPNTNKLMYRVGSGANTFSNADIISAIGGSDWFHCALVRNNSGADVLCYINGELKETKTNIVGSGDNTIVQNIGSRGPTPLDFEIEGQLDEMSLFNSALSAEQISNIYNSGTPTDLTDLSPVAWYRMGENGSYKSPQWLLPNDSNKNKASNYSFEFDGINDYISVTANPLTDFTVSFWIKPNSAGASYEGILGQGTTSAQGGILRYVAWNSSSVNGSISLFLGSWTNVSGTVTNGVWTNIIITYNSTSDELKSYNNGSLYTTISSPNFSAQTTNAHSFERIGLRNGANSTSFGGHIDEVALWDSALTDISSIYNSGTPTTISGAVAHWKMGDDATWDGSAWTIPDAVGSNDATTSSMTIDDRVGEAPNSSYNGLSQNMVEADRKTDTPPT